MAKRKVDFYCYDSKLKGWTLINSREIFDDNGKALELGADGIEGRVERHDQLKSEGIQLAKYWPARKTWFVYENDDQLPKGHAASSGKPRKSLVIVEAPQPKAEPNPKQTRKAKAKANPELDELREQLAAMQAVQAAILDKLSAQLTYTLGSGTSRFRFLEQTLTLILEVKSMWYVLNYGGFVVLTVYTLVINYQDILWETE